MPGIRDPMRGIQNARLSWIPLLFYARLGVWLSDQRDMIGLTSLKYDKHPTDAVYYIIYLIFFICNLSCNNCKLYN